MMAFFGLVFSGVGAGLLMWGLFLIHPGLLLCFMGVLTTGLGKVFLA